MKSGLHQESDNMARALVVALPIAMVLWVAVIVMLFTVIPV